MSLDAVEQQLSECGFYRCNQSVLVNLRHGVTRKGGAVSISIPEYAAMLTIAACFAMPFFIYRGFVMQRVFCGRLLTAYSFVAENIIIIISSFAFSLPVAEIASHQSLYYIGAYASKALALVLAIVVFGRRRTRIVQVPFTYHLSLLIIVCICVGLSVADIMLVIQTNEVAAIIYALSEVAFMLLSVLMLFLFEKFQSFAERELYMAAVEQQLVQNEQMFKLMKSRNYEIRSIKYDMTNHMTGIRKLAEECAYDGVQSYIQTYISESLTAIKKSATGNPCIRRPRRAYRLHHAAPGVRDVSSHFNRILRWF